MKKKKKSFKKQIKKTKKKSTSFFKKKSKKEKIRYKKKNKSTKKIKKIKKILKKSKKEKIRYKKKTKSTKKIKKIKKILKKNKIKKISKNIKFKKSSKNTILKIIRLVDILKPKFTLNLNLDYHLQSFFQNISDKVSEKIEGIKAIIEEEKQRKKEIKIQRMRKEKVENIKRLKLEKKLALEEKEKEFKEEIKYEKERKKELQKFIRLEQAEVRKEQAEKQRKFLEQIKLEKKIDQFRKREALEIKNLEKYVLSQERDSYTGVQERINKIKLKYQSLRDQKIRERVEQLGVKVEEGDNRTILLEKERQYNIERQKIEFALESFYRSAHSLCFQINKRYIPKYLSIMRVIDRRFETGEIFIKWDDSLDEDWLILIYIKNNSPDEGIIIEDKTDVEKNISYEFKSNEIFKASDMMVDSLTRLLDKERQKKNKI